MIQVSEDDPNTRKYLTDLLGSNGYSVIGVSNARDTIKVTLAMKPHAIITDNQKIPDNLSGLNMTWDICRHPDLRETLIFMRTMDRIEPVFLWYGGDYYLWKFWQGFLEFMEMVTEYLHH